MLAAGPEALPRIEPPILVWEDDALTVSPSVEEAVRAIRPTALQEGGVVAHDARGRRVLLAVEVRRRRWFGFRRVSRDRVVVTGVDDSPVHAEVLALRLERHLASRGEERLGIAPLPLQELVRRAARASARG